MNLTQPNVQHVLHEHLTSHLVRNYSVKEFCEALGISRGVFYRSYSGLNDLLSAALEREIKQHFHEHTQHKSRKLIQALLIKISENRIYYINIFYLSKKDNTNHVCKHVQAVFFEELRQHLFNSNYSNKTILNSSQMIVARLINWIAHDCEEKVLDVYNNLADSLPKDY